MKKTISILLILLIIGSTSFANLAMVLAQPVLEGPDTPSANIEQTLLDGEKEEVEQHPQEEKVMVTLSNVGKDLDNIFTFTSMKIGDEEIVDGDIIEIQESTIATLKFYWNTEDLSAKNGDWAEMKLPDIFKMVTTPDQTIIVEGNDVGTYRITNGVLRFDFNKNVEEDDVTNGFVDLGLEFYLEKFKENIEQKIPFNDKDEKILYIIARPNAEVTDIEKEGHPDSEHDAKEITWTIDVINTNEEKITNAIVKDIIPEGLVLQEDSFVIKELIIGLEGAKTVGNVVSAEPTNSSINSFEIGFETIAPYKGYRIQYTTTIKDYLKESFTNKATFSYGNEELPAEDTVGGLTRSNPIEKDGWQVGDTDVIKWRIAINKSGNEIENAIVDDTLPAGLEIVEGSIEVYKIIEDEPVEEEGIDTSKFPITLGELKSTDEYQIRFKTKIDYSIVNGGDYQKDNNFNNKTQLKDGDIVVGEGEKNVKVKRAPILRKVGISNVNYENKTLTWTVDVNEAGHLLGDVVLTDLIPAGLGIDEDDIKITYANGDDYTPETPVSIIVNPITEGKTEVIINLENLGKEKLIITYTTEITDFTINNFTNSVGMTGIGIGEEGEEDSDKIDIPGNSFEKDFIGIDYNEKTIDWEISVDPKREAITELTIEDTFPNKGMILLPNTVEVSFTEEVLVEGTDYTLAPRTEGGETGYHKGFIIELKNISEENPLDNGTLVITYTTSYDPQLSVASNVLDPHEQPEGEDQDRIYKNRAHFIGKTENDNDINTEAEVKKKVREDSWNSGKKEGQLVHYDEDGDEVDGWVSGSERKIAWQLYINYQQQDLGEGVVVTDTLGYIGTIDTESIKVSVYDVDGGGNTEITNNVLDSTNYSVNFGKVTIDDKEYDQLILVFAEEFEVKERYVIEFTTTVPNISQENYTNNANVKVGGIDYPYSKTLDYDRANNFLEKGTDGVDGTNVFTGDEIDWEVTVNETLSIIEHASIIDTISAGLVYVDGSLEIVKLEGKEEVALEEEQDYTLVKDTTADDKTTLNINLKEDLENTLILRYKTVVTETGGQVNNTVTLEGTAIEMKTKNSESLKARQFSSVGGEWATDRGALRVTKVDAEEDEVITNNEATFTLWYNLNGEKVQYGDVIYTTENGVLTIGNLPLRTYYLREVAAPTGYVLSEEELEIEVDNAYGDDEEKIAVGSFENTKEKIEITGTKEWNGGKFNRPESIKIQIYREIGDGEKEIVGDAIELVGTDEEPWTHIWTGLDKTDMEGNEYEYTVDEVEIPENYIKSSAEGLTVTNTYVIPKIEKITATKEWVDGPEDKPTVWFKLYRQVEDGEVEEVPDAEIQELSGGMTQLEWTDLDATDVDGNEYVFLVQEVDEEGNDFTPENYEKAENGLTIKNHYISPTDASAKAVKEWENGSPDRPTVWFKLYRAVNGGEIEAIPESEAEIKALTSGTTEVVWTGLTKTDSLGNEYTFSVKEVNAQGEDARPENYTKVEEGLRVSNTYVIPKGDVTGTKVWVDGPEEKPSIELKLYRDGEAYGDPVVLNGDEATPWTHTWTDLDATDEKGVEYIYTIDEVEVPENYKKAISDDGLTITNTRDLIEMPNDPEPTGPGSADRKPDGDGAKLPKTATSMYNYLLLGAGMLGTGGITSSYLRRKNRKNLDKKEL